MARDYAAEYRRRIERGLASGKTRQEARGHREEIRAPGEQSTYETRRERSFAARLRRADDGLTRAESIRIAGRYIQRWGVPQTAKILDLQDRARATYADRSIEYDQAVIDLAEYYDYLNDAYIAANYEPTGEYEDWDDYYEIDFGDPPDYSACLFYH